MIKPVIAVRPLDCCHLSAGLTHINQTICAYRYMYLHAHKSDNKSQCLYSFCACKLANKSLISLQLSGSKYLISRHAPERRVLLQQSQHIVVTIDVAITKTRTWENIKFYSVTDCKRQLSEESDMPSSCLRHPQSEE